MKYLYLLSLMFLAFCNSSQKKNNDNNLVQNSDKEVTNLPKLSIKTPTANLDYKPGEKVEVEVGFPDSILVDSMVLSVDYKVYEKITQKPFKFSWILEKNSVGDREIDVVAYYSGKKSSKRIVIEVLSDIIPTKYKYSVVNAYPHDEMAYTQGLLIDDNELFESTGLQQGGTLRRVDLKSGEVLQNYTIQDDFFCEGISIYNNKIYQLTWQSNVAFVYDKKTFQLLNKFSFSTEGWGITTIDNELFMSDGSFKLYVIDPETFMVKRIVDVYDDKGAVPRLNELEYIKGEIYANIYQTDKIARIDAKTGRVLGYVDLSGILSEKDRTTETDVLNGICYNKKTDKIYVTGKKWKKLFEIKVIK